MINFSIKINVSKYLSLIFITIISFPLLAQLNVRPSVSSDIDLNDREGRIMRFHKFAMNRSGAKWEEDESYNAIFCEDPDVGGYYKLEAVDYRNNGRYRSWSPAAFHTLSIKGNRSYIISILMQAQFERPDEVNAGIYTMDDAGNRIQAHINGLTNKTEGWQRWEWEITTDPRAKVARFEIRLENFPPGNMIKIADVALIELHEKELVPFEKGTGATFRGGPGNLPMKIISVDKYLGQITVQVTAASYIFDLGTNTISGQQMVENKRNVFKWQSSLDLKDLEILVQNEKECVLANDNITFGIQSDGLIMVVPHNEIRLELESLIGGKWNRLSCGHLLVRDDIGGFAVNPVIPRGTGRFCRIDAGIEPGRVTKEMIDFAGKVNDQESISRADPGWRLRYYLSPGERLGISVFPPRPYAWNDSFHSTFTIGNSHVPVEKYEQWGEYADVIILWNFTDRTWANSYEKNHTVRDTELFKKHIHATIKAGMKPIPYMSPYYYYSRDPEEFAGQLIKFRDEWGMEGAYFDAVPSLEWLIAYEEMRLAREIYPDGFILLHATGHAYDGGPPLGEPSIKIPAVETYADAAYTGEHVYGYGKSWAYPRYITAQYRLSNIIGFMKHNGWDGMTSIQRDLKLLQYNGRACLLPSGHEGSTDEERLAIMKKLYFPTLRELERLWKEKGKDPQFYEKFYLPKAMELTEPYLPKEEGNPEGRNSFEGEQFVH